jgi:hypothetical protein
MSNYLIALYKEIIMWHDDYCNKRTPRECYYYAKDIIKGPFPLVEKIISTNLLYTYYYAVRVLKGPFALGEPVIAKSADYSYCYAIHVLKGRFLLGEKAIANDFYYKNQYEKLFNVKL